VGSFEIDQPATETPQALIIEPFDQAKSLFPPARVKLAAQIAIGVGEEAGSVDLLFDVVGGR
jgi:hypothetical protein